MTIKNWNYVGLNILVDYNNTNKGMFWFSNNVWNPGNLIYNIDYSQNIQYDTDNMQGSALFTWDWKSSNQITAYPEIIWGGKFEVGNLSNAIQVKYLSNLIVDYNFKISGDTNNFNIAFSIWSNKIKGGTFSTVNNETMIWVHSNGWNPSGASSYNDGNFKGQIYVNQNWGDHSGIHTNSWTYTAVITYKDMLAGSLNLSNVLKNLIANGYLNPNDYIEGVELGTEIAGGVGNLTINSINYNMNTKKIFDVASTYNVDKVTDTNYVGNLAFNEINYNGYRHDYKINLNSTSIIINTVTNVFIQDTLEKIEKINFIDSYLYNGNIDKSFSFTSYGNGEIHAYNADDRIYYDWKSSNVIINLNQNLIIVSDKVNHHGNDNIFGDIKLNFVDLLIDTSMLTKTAALSHSSIVNLVELYIASFNRAPDSVGLDYWGSRYYDGLNKIPNGMSLEQIAKSFFTQKETIAAYPSGMATKDFVTTVYNNVLSRGPDTGGLNYWVGQLDKGIVSKDSFLLAIINGAMASTGSAVDRQTLANKEAVGEHYAIYQGLNNSTNWAKDVMSAVTDQMATVTAANAKSDAYAAIAANPATSDLVVKLVGVAV